MAISGVKIVMIGGGTGSFTLLSGLKNYTQNITAIVNMVDDGGSTGVLRDELGVLPPGDVRQCLVALSSSPQVIRDLFNYRFGEGTFAGHAFGNLFLTALEKTTGNFADAVYTAGKILNIQGSVVPVTLKNIRLVLKTGTKTVEGQSKIEAAQFAAKGLPKLSLKPSASINPKAETAIREADLIVIAPGNLYASIIPALLVKGVSKALKSVQAKVIYVSNLVTKPGQTDGFQVHDFANEIERFAGKGVLDYVLYNTKKPNNKLLAKYAKKGEHGVDYDLDKLSEFKFRAIGEDLLSRAIAVQDPNDKFIKRTLIRHDSDKVARQLMRLYFS